MDLRKKYGLCPISIKNIQVFIFLNFSEFLMKVWVCRGWGEKDASCDRVDEFWI
jgi:hypothetical protein